MVTFQKTIMASLYHAELLVKHCFDTGMYSQNKKALDIDTKFYESWI